MKIGNVLVLAVLAATAGMAQEEVEVPAAAPSARLAYQQQQALQEVPRLMQQFDQLVANQDAIVSRLLKLEGGGGTDDLRAEIATLRAEIADLRASIRREQDAMRREIVTDLAGRMAKMAPPPPPPAPVATPAPARSAGRAAPPPPPPIGPHYEYKVEPGQTLSFIAKGFNTTTAKIIAANPGLKANHLRVGQVLIIPAEDVPAKGGKKGKR